MPLRQEITEALKASMRAGQAERTSTIRMALAKMKEADIAGRPKGVEQVGDDEIVSLLRSMVKSRRESAQMYRQGKREELAAKEEAEIGVIEEFLPRTLEGEALAAAVRAAVAETGAATVKDMGKVMAALKARHASALDMAAASAATKAALGA